MQIPVFSGQVNLQFVGDNLPTGAEVTFGVNAGSSTPQAIAAVVETVLGSADIMSLFSDDQSIANIHVKVGPNETGAFADLPVDIPGEKTEACVSSAVSLLVKKNTAFGGREGSGRMFWPGLVEPDIGSDGTIESSALTALQTAFESFRTGMSSAGHALRLLHNSATTPYLITSLAVDPVAATQRRRQRR